MNISPRSLLPLPRYQQRRARERARAIAHRRARSLMLGPAMYLQFEDELSVRYQIHEVLRAEGITDPEEVQHTIDSYAHLLGDGRQWHATLFIQLPDAAQRARDLPLLSRAAHRLYLRCEGLPRTLAEANEDLDDRHLGRPSAVHFLRFELPTETRSALCAGQAAAIGCAHPGYAWQRQLPKALLGRLRLDLHPAVVP
jgi:hypothetical protein